MRFSWRRLVSAVGFIAAFLFLCHSLASVSPRTVLGSRRNQQPLHDPNPRENEDEAVKHRASQQLLRQQMEPSTPLRGAEARPAGSMIEQTTTSMLSSMESSSHGVPNIAPHLIFERSEAFPFEDTTDTGSSSSVPSIAKPPKTDYTKTVVMGKLASEDTDWVHTMLPDWQSAVYVVDLPANATSPTGLKTTLNRAKEAMPYLTYIIDHYPNFPDIVAFIHAHRMGYPQAWHTDAVDHDAVRMLHSLALPLVAERGYLNLRCILSPGCPAEIAPFRHPPRPDRHAEQLFAAVYADFFHASLDAVRHHLPLVAAPCCAQFAVSRAQLLRRPRAAYERYRAYLLAADPRECDDETLGTVMEYMWHLIFGRDAVHCPSARTCGCEVFGRCTRYQREGGRGDGERRGPRTGARRPGKLGGRPH